MVAVVKELSHEAATLLTISSPHHEDHQLGVRVSTIECAAQVGPPSPLLLNLSQPMSLAKLFPQIVLIAPKPREDGKTKKLS
ncbi:unnamed protein product [Sphagnum jensenii]|jgi:hypothetical protein|uniref:Uncharacterized protein n=1 Tax=Sphagnum jensenii TaxID=128206 RepID=A0ABP1BUI6_9BRYO